MKKEYDFSKMKAVKNPYAKVLKKQITIRLNVETIDYFKNMAEELDIPYIVKLKPQQAVLDGCSETGVTAQCMDTGIDTGDILMKSVTPIGENETADELHDRLSLLGAELIVKVVHAAQNGTLTREKQDESKATHVGKLTKEMSAIDFSKPAQQVHNLVRGLNSWPSASANLEGRRIKIHRTVLAQGRGEPGQVLSLQPLVVACGEGAVQITELQPEGKKKMDAAAFVNGLHKDSPQGLKFT